MSVDILKLKALATAAKRDQYDYVALNDYGMAMPPAVTLELIAEIERHRQVNAEGGSPDNNILPVVAVEGDQLVIRITTECLLHAVTCSSQWPANEAGSPISVINGPLMVKEIIHELQREDEQGTNSMHRMLDEAALAALDNGSEAVSYDDEAHP
ncbi:hypothetical protein GCM10009504_27000 [Pseudomonas laurentiana]|uniref:Uncharacterized protein n=1 Tax=Pseudomonas laurentiana TaxID=2364649 RepID=A0A6I5RTM0_9PSED|nr:hypothetical protein [Pseudomonas laurentiana]NES11079.1 hypothetical protein [Pseudomonas laurentiana]GGU68452.1 hypothetical protein GCM10009504_27000 [Pseudomonas laurentiana]